MMAERSANRTDGSTYAPLNQPEMEVPKPRAGQRRSWWERVYNRLSQTVSDPDPDHEQGLVPPPVPRKPSSRRRSRRQRPSIKASETVLQDYNDPPPPSVIQTYRQSIAQAASGSTPGIHVVEASFQPEPPLPSLPPLPSVSRPQDLSPSHLSPPQSPRRSPRRKAAPRPFSLPPDDAIMPSPLLSPVTTSDRTDSFLARAFPDVSDISCSVDGITTGPPSSQSHRSNVRLGGDRSVVANGVVVAQAPVVIQLPQLASFERLVEMPHSPLQPQPASIESNSPRRRSDPSKTRRSSHRRDSALHHSPEQSSSPGRWAELPPIPPISPMTPLSPVLPPPSKPYVPRRDQIVLPARLAPPTAGPSRPREDANRGTPHHSILPSPPPGLPSAQYALTPKISSPISPPEPSERRRSKRRLSTEPERAPTPLDFSRLPTSSPSETTIRPETAHKPHQLRRSTYNVKRHSVSQVPVPEVQGRPNRRVSAPPDPSPLPLPEVQTGAYIPRRHRRSTADGTPSSSAFLGGVVEGEQFDVSRYPSPQRVQSRGRHERDLRR